MLAGDVAKVDWLQVIRAEYLEFPGMVLTEPQVRRLWGLDAATCTTVLTELVRSGFLKRTRSDSYARANNY
jgi:hypothetical protein